MMANDQQGCVRTAFTRGRQRSLGDDGNGTVSTDVTVAATAAAAAVRQRKSISSFPSQLLLSSPLLPNFPSLFLSPHLLSLSRCPLTASPAIALLEAHVSQVIASLLPFPRPEAAAATAAAVQASGSQLHDSTASPATGAVLVQSESKKCLFCAAC